MIRERVILCFGDSLTWGEEPGSGRRFPREERWPGIMAKCLGEEYLVLEDGLGGRCTVYDDPWYECRNGKKALGYTLNAQKPLDAVVLMLGTNDLKVTDVYGAARGVQTLIRMLKSANVMYPAMPPFFCGKPKILLVAPPAFHPYLDEKIEAAGGNAVRSALVGKCKESRLFGEVYRLVADAEQVRLLDASLYAMGALPDCVHIDRAAHARLGAAMAEQVRALFQNEADS